MAIPIAIGALVFALVGLAAGLVAGSAAGFIFAALASAVAVVALRYRAGQNQRRGYITDEPDIVMPDWGQSTIDLDAPPPPPPSRHTSTEKRGFLPVAIDNYEDLVASEILPSLETLSVEQLEQVILREQRGLGRVSVMRRAQTLIDLTRPSRVQVQDPIVVDPGYVPDQQRGEPDITRRRPTARHTPEAPAPPPRARVRPEHPPTPERKPPAARKPPQPPTQKRKLEKELDKDLDAPQPQQRPRRVKKGPDLGL